MKIACWNVNSIRTRLDHVLRWLEESGTDVLCLQETKVEDDLFPWVELEARGYRSLALGERAYNGVAIVSRLPTSEVVSRLPGDPGDEEARFLSALVGEIRVVSCYVPNGDTVGTEKWQFKLDWFRRLLAYLGRHRPEEPLLLCGDFNIAPEDRDCWRPEVWALSVLCHPDGRQAFRELLDWGLVDLFRRHHQEAGRYSWWDYSPRCFKRNEGLRIDHLLATRSLAERCRACDIDTGPRGWTRPSDHTPVWAEFEPG
ncbi:MAG: exodeoxyribonuclease III [Candidatus Eremiobacterota bacterium]